jgi:hypothetical protein
MLFQTLLELRQLLLRDTSDIVGSPVLFQQAARLLVQEPEAQL